MNQAEYHTTKLLPAISKSLREKVKELKSSHKKNLKVKAELNQPAFYTKPIFKARKYNFW